MPRDSRPVRRQRAREQARLVRDQERLARLQPGGAPERPLQVESPAQVDVVATASPCPLCGGTLRLEEHAAERVGGVSLRVARLRCTRCGISRSRYFRLVNRELH
ncbi:MAG: hypothetical protein E6J75_16665 [Deltaproteobacteria bacterium]|nr:MAG: hypothetical protein E6J75_16665 [Deltaproteobacteria bacterium]